MNLFDWLSQNYNVKPDGTITKNGKRIPSTLMEVSIDLMSNGGASGESLESINGLVEQWAVEANPDVKVDFIIDGMVESPFNTLTDKDWYLLLNLRWAISPAGTQIIFFRDHWKSNTYKVVEDPDNVFTVLASCKSAYRNVSEQYLKYVTEAYKAKEYAGLLVWDMNTKSAAKGSIPKYPKYSLAEYLKKTMEYLLGSVDYMIEHPKIITNDPTAPCFVYIDNDKRDNEVGNFEEWTNWINWRFYTDYDRDIFKAYMYSIFDSENTARQALWLLDNGQTGKTTIINALVTMMKSGAVSMNDQGGADSQFFGSAVYGKRLLTSPDNKNTSLIRKGIVHQILGGDNIPIEFKNKSSFMGKVHCKMIIASNYKPEIDTTQVHEKSRVLLLKLRPNKDIKDQKIVQMFTHGTPSHVIEGKLVDQLPAFIASCKEAYLKLCPSRNNIILSQEEDEDMFESITTPDTERYEYILNNYFDQDEDAVIGKAVMQNIFSILYGRGNTSFKYSDFKKHLESEVPFYSEGRGIDSSGKRASVIRGIKLNVEKAGGVAAMIEDPTIMQYISEIKEKT